MILRKRHFAAWQINWGDKVSNMTALAKELNLGIDSFVFLDDDPFQENLMREAFPSVATIASKDEKELVEHLKRFPGFVSFTLTEEDRRRGEMYAQERERRTLEASSQTLEDFLKNLELSVTMSEVSDATLPRAAQLTQKTNQFNLTTKRYTEEQLKQFLADGGKAWTVAAKDRFGDYGIIGLLMAKPKAAIWDIENFLLSCRILGKGVEQRVVDFFAKEAERGAIKDILAKYIPTSKNGQVEKFWDGVGFTENATQSADQAVGAGTKWYHRSIV